MGTLILLEGMIIETTYLPYGLIVLMYLIPTLQVCKWRRRRLVLEGEQPQLVLVGRRREALELAQPQLLCLESGRLVSWIEECVLP